MKLVLFGVCAALVNAQRLGDDIKSDELHNKTQLLIELNHNRPDDSFNWTAGHDMSLLGAACHEESYTNDDGDWCLPNVVWANHQEHNHITVYGYGNYEALSEDFRNNEWASFNISFDNTDKSAMEISNDFVSRWELPWNPLDCSIDNTHTLQGVLGNVRWYMPNDADKISREVEFCRGDLKTQVFTALATILQKMRHFETTWQTDVKVFLEGELNRRQHDLNKVINLINKSANNWQEIGTLAYEKRANHNVAAVAATDVLEEWMDITRKTDTWGEVNEANEPGAYDTVTNPHGFYWTTYEDDTFFDGNYKIPDIINGPWSTGSSSGSQYSVMYADYVNAHYVLFNLTDGWKTYNFDDEFDVNYVNFEENKRKCSIGGVNIESFDLLAQGEFNKPSEVKDKAEHYVTYGSKVVVCLNRAITKWQNVKTQFVTLLMSRLLARSATWKSLIASELSDKKKFA